MGKFFLKYKVPGFFGDLQVGKVVFQQTADNRIQIKNSFQ